MRTRFCQACVGADLLRAVTDLVARRHALFAARHAPGPPAAAPVDAPDRSTETRSTKDEL